MAITELFHGVLNLKRKTILGNFPPPEPAAWHPFPPTGGVKEIWDEILVSVRTVGVLPYTLMRPEIYSGLLVLFSWKSFAAEGEKIFFMLILPSKSVWRCSYPKDVALKWPTRQYSCHFPHPEERAREADQEPKGYDYVVIQRNSFYYLKNQIADLERQFDVLRKINE